MAIANMTDMLIKARAGKYAVGAFNILDYNSFKAVVDAASELNAPVIVQISVKTVKLWGYDAIVSWYRQLSENVKVPVAMHLDHCKDIDVIENCIKAGWTSVMIDASSKPFEENMKLTRQVVEMATSANVSVEAELGEIGGVEDDIVVAEENAHLADPAKAELFCQEIDLQCFAPAIGTAHGVYKGEPKIDFDRLKTIAGRTPVPLALHGGTGLSSDVFRKCISLGCAKVNISTQLKHAFINEFVKYHQAHPNEYEPVKVLAAQYEQLKQEVKENIEFFGSSGKGE
ncbi:ketose-bisphosphate aldolase [candidate division KSB1 bacterium]|nr:ketose-bisphosphate aldolase [candidate division KSB1 bacterium]